MEVSGERKERSFKDSVGKSSTDEEEVFCQPCSSEGDWMIAVGYCRNCNEYFCSACLRPHRKQSATKHHVILEGKHMPQPQLSQMQLDPCSEQCIQHKDEIVKFFCSSHDAVGCSDCMVLSHKTCKVDRIQDLSTNFFSSQEHKELVEMIGKFLNDLDLLNQDIRRSEKCIDKTYSKAVDNIRTFRKEVNNYLDKAEADILAEVNKRKQTDEQMLAKLETDKQSLQKDVQEIEEKLKQQSNKANNLFVAAKKMKKRMSSLNATLKQMVKNSTVKEYSFEPNPDVKQITVSQSPFGKLTENPESRQQQKKVADMVPKYEGAINLRMQKDESLCMIIAFAIVSSTKIALSDHSNKCVKLADIEQRKLLARYCFQTKSSDVAKVNDYTVAVTLPEVRKLQFLSITHENKFTIAQNQTMNLNYPCTKLFCEENKLFLASVGKIEIRTMSGSVMKEITFPDLTWPSCIACAYDSESFFVSNRMSQGKISAVYKVCFDGRLVATYKDDDLRYIEGLTVTRDGTVFVCNWSYPGSIHVLSTECKKIKEILQDNEQIRCPCSVSFCDDTNKLYICNCTMISPHDKRNDFLEIFQMF